MDLSWMGVLCPQASSFWGWVPHHLLWWDRDSFWSWVSQRQGSSKRMWTSRLWATCRVDWRASSLPYQVSAWIRSLRCSWFWVCLLQALTALRLKGVFSGALIKKRRYWPALVRGDVIDAWFADPVGSAGAVTGTLDGVKYNIWAMKDMGDMAKLMGTGSGLLHNDNSLHSCLLEDRSRVQFRYSEPYQLYFQCCKFHCWPQQSATYGSINWG